MIYLLSLLLGFIPLIFGANLLVDSASSLAKRFNIPGIVIGLTIVAFGTSSPEMIVNIFASINNNPDIVSGNIIGSNIFNILGILGISAVIYPLAVKTNTTWIEVPLCLLSSVAVLIVSNDIFIDHLNASMISRTDGMILLLFFMIFIVYNIQMMKHGSFNEEIAVKNYSLFKIIIFIIFSLILIVSGARIIVFSSVRFARFINVPERIIALTIISIGTSLPELATSVVAAKKKNVDIAIGNIVGSNIFNVFFILGLSAVIAPIPLRKISNFDMLVNLIASVLLFTFIFTGKGRKIEQWEGIIFILLYLLYVTTLILI
ncbi:MAG: calcium/sodium antiporter [Spirochaetes bacterium]|nr:calcium/sodium antiporter [Spirochaetota bacterium]